jgi:hypothetical protein
MKDESRREVLAKLGVAAAAAVVGTKAAGCAWQQKQPTLSAEEIAKTKEAIAALSPTRGVAVSIPEQVSAAGFEVDVRGTPEGFFAQTKPASETTKPGISQDRNTLVLGIKPAAGRAIEIVGLDSVLAQGARMRLYRASGSGGGGGGGRCNLRVMAVRAVRPSPKIEAFSPEYPREALTKF